MTNALPISWLRTKHTKGQQIERASPGRKRKNHPCVGGVSGSCFLSGFISSQESQPTAAELSPLFWPSKIYHLFTGQRKSAPELQLVIRQEIVRMVISCIGNPHCLPGAFLYWDHQHLATPCAALFFFSLRVPSDKALRVTNRRTYRTVGYSQLWQCTQALSRQSHMKQHATPEQSRSYFLVGKSCPKPLKKASHHLYRWMHHLFN